MKVRLDFINTGNINLNNRSKFKIVSMRKLTTTIWLMKIIKETILYKIVTCYEYQEGHHSEIKSNFSKGNSKHLIGGGGL